MISQVILQIAILCSLSTGLSLESLCRSEMRRCTRAKFANYEAVQKVREQKELEEARIAYYYCVKAQEKPNTSPIFCIDPDKTSGVSMRIPTSTVDETNFVQECAEIQRIPGVK